MKISIFYTIFIIIIDKVKVILILLLYNVFLQIKDNAIK